MPLTFLLACTASTPSITAPSDTAPGDSTDTSPPQDTAPAEVAPSVVINELLPANTGSSLSDLGEPADWIELHNPTAEALDLSGFGISDDWTAPLLHTLPAGTVIDPGGFLLLWADGQDGDLHLPFRLDAGGEGVGVFTPDGEAVDWVVFSALEDDTAYARLPDGSDDWVTMPWGTPGTANALLALEALTAIEAAATWAYWDQGVLPAEDWMQVDFADSAWPTGPAPLGYGDSQTTVISYGDDSSNKHITAWFRAAFTLSAISATSATTATLLLMRDDGAVVYLNGTEIARSSMADGVVTADTLANVTASGDSESTFYQYDVDPSALISGENVVAVEVHQASVTSSDTSFDLSLTIDTVVEK